MTKTRANSFRAGFTLVELMVAIAVLALILVAAAKILSTAASLTTSNNKHMDANDQARAVFDRMANDFARIVRRKDVDYIFWKNAGGSDAMYFYTEGDSYFDSTTFSTVPSGVPSNIKEAEKNAVSLVGYRVNNIPAGSYPSGKNPGYFQLERLGKALSCDGGAYNGGQPANNSVQPNFMVFLTYPPPGNDVNGAAYPDLTSVAYSTAYFNSTLAGAFSNNGGGNFGGLPSAVGTYPGGAATTTTFNDSTDTNYRAIGSQVFRFEYSFQLKDGTLTDRPMMVYTGAGGLPGTNGIPSSTITANQRPLPTDDSSKKLTTPGSVFTTVGSRWYDSANQIAYICLDATPGRAIWHEIGIQDIAAVVVSIAVIDKQGLIFVQNRNIDMANVAAQLPDYIVTGTATGDPAYLLDPANTKGWAYKLVPGSNSIATKMTAPKLPQAMVSQIRLYQRYFYLDSF